VFFLLTLPFRIVFGVLLAVLLLPFTLLLLPFFLLRLLIKTAVPLLPIAFLVFCVWAVVRLASPRALTT